MTKARQRAYELGLKNTKVFEYLNLNPKGLITSDCSTRALANAMDISYGEAIDLQAEAAKRLGLGLTAPELLNDILESHGFAAVPMRAVKRGGRRLKVGDAAARYAVDGKVAVMMIAHHFTVARGGKVQDVWDCSGKTVYRLWVK